MSKTNQKLNAKFVGVDAHGDPRFGGITKKENGITLIALIITIIVMLILTGVTLSITLGDNGLVNKAKTASEEMQRAMDKEELLSMVMGAYDAKTGNIDSAALVSKITAKGWAFDESTTLVTNSEGKAIAYLNTTTGAITDITSDSDTDIDINGGTDVEIEEVVNLDGLYYCDIDINTAVIKIENNVMYVENEEYPITIDTTNKTLSFTYTYYDSSAHKDITETITYEYDLVIEDGEVVNKVLLGEYHDIGVGKLIYWQNLNGFTRGEVEGDYVRYNELNGWYHKWTFNPDTKRITKQSSSDGVTWNSDGESKFIHYKGMYFEGNWEILFEDDLNSFYDEISSFAYVKQ